jgi:hypothetical protein
MRTRTQLSVSLYQTRCSIPEDSHLRTCRCENLKSTIVRFTRGWATCKHKALSKDTVNWLFIRCDCFPLTFQASASILCWISETEMHTYQTKGLHRQMMISYTFCHCEFAYLFKTEFWNNGVGLCPQACK